MFFWLYAIIELLAIFLDSGIIPTANFSYHVCPLWTIPVTSTSDDPILLVVTVVCNCLHRPRRSSLQLYPHQWFCWIPIRRRRYTSITLGAYSHRSSPSTIEPLIMPTAYLPQPSLSQPVAGKVQPRMGKLQALSGPSSYPGTSASGSHTVTSQTFPSSHPVGTHLIMTQRSSYVPMWKIYAEKWRRYGLIGHTSLLHHMGSLIQKWFEQQFLLVSGSTKIGCWSIIKLIIKHT